jgi:hypothetical protein
MFLKGQLYPITIEHNDTSQHHNETSELHNATSDLCPSCDVIHDFVRELLVRLNVTTPCCLGNSSACDVNNSSAYDVNNEESEPETSSRTDPAKGMIIRIFASSYLMMTA